MTPVAEALGLLGGASVAGRRGAAHAASFAGDCPKDARPRGVGAQPPSCLHDRQSCDSREDFLELNKLAKAVDRSLDPTLKEAQKARKLFERRACEYRYAGMMGKSSTIEDAYGPNGPLAPGGSYLFELRRWAMALRKLRRTCLRNPACEGLVDHLKEHPGDDVGRGGARGKAGSKIFEEFVKACHVGRHRSPVPNDSPVWCDPQTGYCERKSCRNWWREMHPVTPRPDPWVDDRIDYDDLKVACDWVASATPTDSDINQRQHELDAAFSDMRATYCRPSWVEGYCEPLPRAARAHGECKLPDGGHCPNGLVIPGSKEDVDVALWREKFPEPPVHVQLAPLAPPPAATDAAAGAAAASPRVGRPRSTEAQARARSFL